MKPVVAVPLWLAIPVYLMYAAVWVAAMALAVALTLVFAIGYGIFRLTRRQT